MTVDCIVHDKDKKRIVLVHRRFPPAGWALPGGFVDYGETLEDAVCREIMEETGLKIRAPRQVHAYSEPRRDPRGHSITMVFEAYGKGVPEGSDDARAAGWFDLAALPRPLAFDHRSIIDNWSTQKGINHVK